MAHGRSPSVAAGPHQSMTCSFKPSANGGRLLPRRQLLPGDSGTTTIPACLAVRPRLPFHPSTRYPVTSARIGAYPYDAVHTTVTKGAQFGGRMGAPDSHPTAQTVLSATKSRCSPCKTSPNGT